MNRIKRRCIVWLGVMCLALPVQAAPNGGSIIHVRQPSGLSGDVQVGNAVSGSLNALPERNEAPAISVQAGRSAQEAVECIQQKLRTVFNLPAEFYRVDTYANNALSVSLVNPFTQTNGLQFTITPTGVSGSQIDLYDNGTTLSSAWKRLPGLCK